MSRRSLAEVSLRCGGEPRHVCDELDQPAVEEELGELLVLRAHDLADLLDEIGRRLADVRAPVLVDGAVLRGGARFEDDVVVHLRAVLQEADESVLVVMFSGVMLESWRLQEVPLGR